MAKIELIARPVKLPGYKLLEKLQIAPQHLFIMITKDGGIKSVISGGQEKFGSKTSMFWDDIKVRNMQYTSRNNLERDFENFFKSSVLYEGRDDQITYYAEKMWEKAVEINRGGFDYKLPIIGDEQNSNTVARIIIEGVGLKFKLPSYANGKPVLAASYESEIGHSYVDKKGIGNKIKEFFRAKDMKRKLVDKINKAYVKHPSEIENIRECMERELRKKDNSSKKEKDESGDRKKGQLESEHDDVMKALGYFNSPKIGSKELTNEERFRIISEESMENGDEDLVGVFSGLEAQLNQVNNLFNLMDGDQYQGARDNNERLRIIDNNMNEIKEPERGELGQMRNIIANYKGAIVEINYAFEKCVPSTFYYDEL